MKRTYTNIQYTYEVNGEPRLLNYLVSDENGTMHRLWKKLNKVEAIVLLRNLNQDLGLRDAKDIVEDYWRLMGWYFAA